MMRLRRRKKSRWQATRERVQWYRVRYSDAASATAGIQACAAHAPDNTMFIASQSTPLAHLWVGVAASSRWIVSAAAGYGIQLALADEPAVSEQAANGWQWLDRWPQDDGWLAMLAHGQLYLATNEQTAASVVWPSSNGHHAAMWQLPAPQLGTASQMAAPSIRPLPTPFSHNSIDGLYLGNNGDLSVYTNGRVQVWGDSDALHGWLIALLLHALDGRRVVMLDGHGALSERLPLYAPFVEKLKQGRLRYVHMDDDLRQQGFNPLKRLQGEPTEAAAQRWLRWLSDLGVWPVHHELDRLTLCESAIAESVTTLDALIRWLHGYKEITPNNATYMQRAIRRMTQSTQYAPWLRQPRPLFDRQALIYACALDGSAARRSMMLAVLDAALSMPDVTLIVTGLPRDLLQEVDPALWPSKMVMVNGVRLPDAVWGIGRIHNRSGRHRMVMQTFSADAAHYFEILTIAPLDSVLWLTEPPLQTTL